MAFLLSGLWIGFSEFLRNELLFKGHWLEKYESLGIIFPSSMINNLVWALWSFILAGLILFLNAKLNMLENLLITWIFAFVLMWLVVGNLAVLPFQLLLFAIPLSLLEVLLAVFICRGITKK